MQKIRVKASFVSFSIILLFLCMSCAGTLRSYVSARTILNNYWESYLNARDLMPEGPAKDSFRAKFADTGKSSYFTEASAALDAWRAALNTTSEVEKRQAYYAIFDKIMQLLLSEGIIQVK